jgi:hypothetical protein
MKDRIVVRSFGWLALVAALAGCSGIRTMDTGGVPVVTVADLTADNVGESLGRVGRGEAVVVHFAPGDAVPLHVAASVPFATLESGDNAIRFQRDVYLYVAPDAFLVGPDGRRWAEVSDTGAIKELFGATSGSLQFGFGASASQAAAFNFAVELR